MARQNDSAVSTALAALDGLGASEPEPESIRAEITLDPRCSYFCPHECGAHNYLMAKTCRRCGLDIVYDEEQRRRRALNPPVVPKEGVSLMLCACCGEVGVGGDQHYLPASHARGPRSAEYICRFCLEKCARCMKNKVLTSGDGAHLVCKTCKDEALVTKIARVSSPEYKRPGRFDTFLKQIIHDQLADADLHNYLSKLNVCPSHLIDKEAKLQVALRVSHRRSKHFVDAMRRRKLKLPDEHEYKWFRGLPTYLLNKKLTACKWAAAPLELLTLGEDCGVRFPSEAFDDIFSDIYEYLKTEARAGADPLQISRRIYEVASAKRVVGIVASGLWRGVLKAPFHAHNSVDGSICSSNYVDTYVGP